MHDGQKLFTVILLSLLLGLMSSCSSSKADQAEQLAYIVIDQTSVWPQTARKNYLKMLSDIKTMVTQESKGLKLVATSLTEDNTQTVYLLNLSKEKLHWYDNEKARSIKAKVKAENHRIYAEIDKALKPVMRKQTSGIASPIFEQLFDIANSWESGQEFDGKRLIIFSDMVQYSDSFIFREWLDKDFSIALQKRDPSLIVKKIEKLGLLPDFKGADIQIYLQGDFDAQADSIKDNRKKRAALGRLNQRKRFVEAVWKAYFEKANAQAMAYRQ